MGFNFIYIKDCTKVDGPKKPNYKGFKKILTILGKRVFRHVTTKGVQWRQVTYS
jgi:hypothetical protein